MLDRRTNLEVRRLSRSLSGSAEISLVTLTFNLLTLKLMRIIVRRMNNLSTNFGVSETFHSGPMGQHQPLTMYVMALHVMRLFMFQLCRLPLLKFVGFPIRQI